MANVVITISGKAEAGKDLTAKLIKKELETLGKKTLIVHYADYLKYICKQYYDWDGVKDEKGREILQRVGTNIVRNRNPDFWVNTVIELIKVLWDDYDAILIPDCRFPNEVELMNFAFWDYFISLNVIRENYENTLTETQRLHPSETALDDYNGFDYTIESESGEENLLREVQKFISEIDLSYF